MKSSRASNRIRLVALLFCFATASACATTVVPIQPLSPDRYSDLRVETVSVRVAAPTSLQKGGSFPFSDFREAIEQELSGAGFYGESGTKMTVQVLEYRVVGAVSRFFVGAFGGSSRMRVEVSLYGSDDELIGAYQVTRSSNPGGYGTFYDQEQAILNATARGVVEGLTASN